MCDFCENSITKKERGVELFIDSDGDLDITIDRDNEYANTYIEINYFPMCGRKL